MLSGFLSLAILYFKVRHIAPTRRCSPFQEMFFILTRSGRPSCAINSEENQPSPSQVRFTCQSYK